MSATTVRVIKKYPNRRLYDLWSSAYITLAEVKKMVLQHDKFQVVDAKSGEDLTRSILLQIILEEEAGGAPMFTSDLLAQMIRFYGHAMQGMMGQYLESNIRAFSDMQKKLQEQAASLYGDHRPGQELWSQFMSFQGPAMQSMMSAYIEQSRKLFHHMQANMQAQAGQLFAGFPFPGQTDKEVAQKPESVTQNSPAS
jgi:polyhydroxyalkanoate synthesis repressor PhaR